MFAAYPGDIVFSKIDARSGAIGVLPPEIAKAVVTAEFPVFVPNPERLEGEFAKLVLRTGGFLATLRMKASGTSGRKRITPDAFLDLRLPMPTLQEQRAIVATYRAATTQANALEREAAEIEATAVQAFETGLGFSPAKPLPDRRAFVAAFKDIDRWSHEDILRRVLEGDGPPTFRHPLVRLSDVIGDLENGWSPKCLDRAAQPGEWGVLKLGAVSFGVFDQDENKALPKHLKPRPHLEVKAGQVLISRANITRLVGATGLVRETRTKLILCDKIFRVIPLVPSPIDYAFLTEVLRISYVRGQIEANVTGTSPTMKNISKPALMGLTFPLPPRADQVAMAKTLSDARVRAASLRKAALRLKAKAWDDFEGAIYAPQDATLPEATADA